MKTMLVETVHNVFHLGVESIKDALLPCISVFLCVPVLCGCVTTHASAPLVPPPPMEASAHIGGGMQHDGSLMAAVFFAELPNTYIHNFAPAPGQGYGMPVGASRPEPISIPSELGYERERTALSAGVISDSCSISDRFDRGELIAYEWDRSRLGVDVDGLNMSGGDDQAVKLNYTLRLQPEKPREQRCRYTSSWQGIAGSVYNELMLRQDNTVWDDLRKARKNFENIF